MAKSARQHVFEGMELLPEALTPFVETRLSNTIKGHWEVEVTTKMRGLNADSEGKINWDNSGLLNAMNVYWMEAFASVLGRAERAIINELVEVRNKLAHDEKFSYDDAERALDSMRRLMEAISAGEVTEKLTKVRDTILRTKFTELRRQEERRITRRTDISVETKSGLLSWREIVEPHQDVATGDFQQAEFAADLGKVHAGSAPSEYSDPKEFFARTYLTDGLSSLLVGAAKRLSGVGGDPVVELQTNFGGGKTHSMLALYHMGGGTKAQDLTGLDQLLSGKDLAGPGKVSRAVLVGTSRGPADILDIGGGRKVHTTWGELAWQLGGTDGYDMVAENDKSGIAPGSNLLESLFNKFAPCLILIDEWVAYLRQIYKTEGLAAGSFDANLSFVQSLTEAVKASKKTLLVASLPASQIEVGGEGGQEALARLKQTFSRVESSWRPASQEESYEIVRRRLFKDIPGDMFQHRDNTLKQFAKLYRENSNDFPLGCADEDYRRKLEKAFPIHPELFDQLYTSWGSLEKFQRTRGVLRLMAQVIHELWMNNDPSVMIMPGSVAVSSPRVEPELLHYLEVNWQSIIAGDVDGTGSTPYKIDQSAPNLNRYSAARRVARTIFMGTSPLHQQENKGLDDKQINLGVVQPGERAAVFGDALRRLTNNAKFMHSDMGRYWYSTSASMNRLATDRASQIDDAVVVNAINDGLNTYIGGIGDRGHFDTVQTAPGTSADIPDEPGGVRVVILGVDHPHTGRADCLAMQEVKDILLQRGQTPRVYRNMLAFIAPDSRQLDSLKEAVRLSLGWEHVVRDIEKLNLTQSDSALAKAKWQEAKETGKTRLKEAWCYLIYPTQESPQSETEWSVNKIPSQDGLLSRASKKLISDEGLFVELGPRRLGNLLDKYIWNDKPHLPLKDIWEYINRYTYLPRMKNQNVLANTIKTAVSGLTPGPFAYAQGWSEDTKTYDGLAIEQGLTASVLIDRDSVLVRSEIAEEHRPKPAPDTVEGDGKSEGDNVDPSGVSAAPVPPEDKDPTRFLGTVMVSPDRPAKEIHQIIEAIVEQLTTLPNAEVSIKLEIDAEVPQGLDRNKVRVLMENAATLGFIDKVVK